MLEDREKEIIKTLKKMNNEKFIVVGGYAVNAYTQPRFSVDLDIVISKEELDYFQKFLGKEGE